MEEFLLILVDMPKKKIRGKDFFSRKNHWKDRFLSENTGTDFFQLPKVLINFATSRMIIDKSLRGRGDCRGFKKITFS